MKCFHFVVQDVSMLMPQEGYCGFQVPSLVFFAWQWELGSTWYSLIFLHLERKLEVKIESNMV
jgi:hypothetical protein